MPWLLAALPPCTSCLAVGLLNASALAFQVILGSYSPNQYQDVVAHSSTALNLGGQGEILRPCANRLWRTEKPPQRWQKAMV